jgi:hypothetical protein
MVVQSEDKHQVRASYLYNTDRISPTGSFNFLPKPGDSLPGELLDFLQKSLQLNFMNSAMIQ